MSPAITSPTVLQLKGDEEQDYVHVVVSNKKRQYLGNVEFVCNLTVEVYLYEIQGVDLNWKYEIHDWTFL